MNKIKKTIASGGLRKLQSELATPVIYHLPVGEARILLNDFIGQDITISTTGAIFCIQCGRKTAKSFQQGHCYPCMQRILECNNCILFPERCLVEQGGCPKNDWAHSQCHAEQVIYLANTSNLKIGITRNSQVPTRWIDQGAIQALALFAVKNRYQAGVVEVAFKKYINDRTNWRAMLKGLTTEQDLMVAANELIAQASEDLQPIKAQLGDDFTSLALEKVQRIHYPVNQYPEKVSSLSLDKTPEISGKLCGIKGQYLIFEHGVLNIRKFGGYQVTLMQ